MLTIARDATNKAWSFGTIGKTPSLDDIGVLCNKFCAGEFFKLHHGYNNEVSNRDDAM